MRWTYAILPLGLTAVAAFQDPIFAALPMAPLGKMAWLVFFLGYGVVLPVLLMTLAGRSPLQIADELGLAKSPWGAFAFALVVTSPVAVGFALTTGINPALTAREVLFGAIVFPWIEEVFFRGVLFGQLYRRAGWGFWPSALTPAIVFALAHLRQSQDPGEIAGRPRLDRLLVSLRPVGRKHLGALRRPCAVEPVVERVRRRRHGLGRRLRQRFALYCRRAGARLLLPRAALRLAEAADAYFASIRAASAGNSLRIRPRM